MPNKSPDFPPKTKPPIEIKTWPPRIPYPRATWRLIIADAVIMTSVLRAFWLLDYLGVNLRSAAVLQGWPRFVSGIKYFRFEMALWLCTRMEIVALAFMLSAMLLVSGYEASKMDRHQANLQPVKEVPAIKIGQLAPLRIKEERPGNPYPRPFRISPAMRLPPSLAQPLPGCKTQKLINWRPMAGSGYGVPDYKTIYFVICYEIHIGN